MGLQNERNPMNEIFVMLESLQEKVEKSNSLNRELWSLQDITDYLGVFSFGTIRDRITKQETFPAPIRISSSTGAKSKRIYKSAEVRKWAERHTDRSGAH